jgi:hypothetical protein
MQLLQLEVVLAVVMNTLCWPIYRGTCRPFVLFHSAAFMTINMPPILCPLVALPSTALTAALSI